MENVFFLTVAKTIADGVTTTNSGVEIVNFTDLGLSQTIKLSNERSYFEQFVTLVSDFDVHEETSILYDDSDIQMLFGVDELLNDVKAYHEKLTNMVDRLNTLFYKGRVIDANTTVFVYYNLHLKMFSVRALEGEHKGKVVMHWPQLFLRNVSFKVSETGRMRVLAEKRKNVHAGVVGCLDEGLNEKLYSIPVTYNPYKYETFVNAATGERCLESTFVRLENKQVWSSSINKRIQLEHVGAVV